VTESAATLRSSWRTVTRPLSTAAAVGVQQGIVAFDVDAMIVDRDVGRANKGIFGRGGANIRGTRQGACQAEENKCGPNVRSHGQKCGRLSQYT